MKYEIMNLINSTDGEAHYFRLNNVSFLCRYTKDALGEDVDKLYIDFDSINNVCFGICDREIKARDYDGIIKECQQITKRFFENVSTELCCNIGAGYRNVTRKNPY